MTVKLNKHAIYTIYIYHIPTCKLKSQHLEVIRRCRRQTYKYKQLELRLTVQCNSNRCCLSIFFISIIWVVAHKMTKHILAGNKGLKLKFRCDTKWISFFLPSMSVSLFFLSVDSVPFTINKTPTCQNLQHIIYNI